MFQTDQATAAASLPTPAAAGTQGFFTNGNPSTGVAATILDADFMNMVMLELANVVTGAGLTLSKTTYNQVLAAIKQLAQSGSANYAGDSGAANAYAATYSPAITSFTNSLVLRFLANHANTGPSTFNPNGLGAYPIWGANHQPLQGGEIALNGDVWIQWNSALNGGSGAFVLLECTGGALQIAPATQSQHAVQLGQVQARGIQASGITVVTTTGTLAASVAGGTVSGNAASATTQTLPAAGSVASGVRIEFININTGVMTVSRAGSDTITANSAPVTTIALGNGDTLTLESNGANGWYAVGGSVQLAFSAVFGSSKAVNGYQKLPGGLILQWGSVTQTTAQNVAVTFPIAFPNAVLSTGASSANSTGTNNGASTYTTTLSGMSVALNANYSFTWYAIGQ
ncbi:hypothetical protein PPGU19_012130 [Paraburkholderia sp. PGU19]|uniref:gp53-like domain-containing protein n=1 Tax=Paraburkholderia sp. PGU19 TaxID=2735434 RepID=UPI0015DB7A93|nr:hypothetical protein [Paraburkholderia sp. PGU19]BCF96644.1 hypothetical protein PPGU19_012130 [Paraburkholderia sp. PGU19]